MKNMNMKERYWTINLQLFAGDGGDDDPGDEGGDDDDNDDPGDDDDDSDDDELEENEKKFSQKDVDDAVKKRLAREKRKWQREQRKKAGSKKKPDGKEKTGIKTPHSLMVLILSHLPDVPVVFGNGSVGGEIARLGDVYNHHFRKGASVLVCLVGLLLGFHIGTEVKQGHEPVFI